VPRRRLWGRAVDLVELQPRDVAAVAEVQLLQNVVDMVLDRRRAEVQAARNFLVGEVTREQCGDFALSPGEQDIDGRAGMSVRECRYPAEQERGDPGGTQ
jgi:hypothetical protein